MALPDSGGAGATDWRRDLSAFQGRLYGRVSEILFNVWLEEEKKQGRTVFEVACIYIDKINWRRKIISFLRGPGKILERSE